MKDCKDVLRIPEELDKLDSESDRIIFIEVIAFMERKLNGQCIHLLKQEMILRCILDEKQIISSWCCQEKKRQSSFKDALKYKNQLFCTSEISDRILCLVFTISVHKKDMKIRESLKKSKNAKRLCECGILESC